MQKEIKKINKVSTAKILTGIYGCFAFLFSLFAFFILLIGTISQQGNNITTILFHIGTGALVSIFIGLIAGAMGFAVGFIAAGIYNLSAKTFGGIKIEFNDLD